MRLDVRCLNIQSLFSKGLETRDYILTEPRADIWIITEPKHGNVSQIATFFRDKGSDHYSTYFTKPHGTTAKGGVVIMVSKRYRSRFAFTLGDSILGILVQAGGKTLSVIGVYNRDNRPEWEVALDAAKNHRTRFPLGATIVAGDFNKR